MSEQARALYQRWKEQQATQRSRSGPGQPGRPRPQPRATAAGRGPVRCRPVQGTDVMLGTEEGTGAPVLLPYAHRDRHFTIVGDTGTGKTTLLERLVRQDIVDGTACVVFDVHGDMTDNLLRFAASQPAWAARTLLVELDPTGADPPFGANLYEVAKSGMAGRAIDGVEAYLRRFWGEAVSGALIESGLTITTRTMVANPGYTMAEVPLLYSNPAFLAKLLKNIPDTLGPDESIHDYWREYSKLTRPYDREMWRRSVINKLERFLGDELTYPVLAQSRSTIGWEEILGGGYCLLVRPARASTQPTRPAGTVSARPSRRRPHRS